MAEQPPEPQELKSRRGEDEFPLRKDQSFVLGPPPLLFLGQLPLVRTEFVCPPH